MARSIGADFLLGSFVSILAVRLDSYLDSCPDSCLVCCFDSCLASLSYLALFGVDDFAFLAPKSFFASLVAGFLRLDFLLL